MKQVAGIIAFFAFMGALWFLGGEQKPQQKQGTAGQDQYMSIATGGLTGIYYPVGGAMCRLVNRNTDKHNYQCSVESTGGTVYNLNALARGEFDFAIAQSDLLYQAYQGDGKVQKSVKPNPHIRTVLTLYTEPLNILAREKNIQTFMDLKGRRLNIGAPGSGQRATMQALMKAAGFEGKSFGHLSGLNPVEQTLALCDEKVDAIAYVVGNPNGSIQEACSTCDARLISIDENLINALVNENPYYVKATIPVDMYKGSKQDVQTFGVKVVLTTLESVDAKMVKSLVDAVIQNIETFKRLHPVLGSLSVQDMLSSKDLVAPQHEGVKAYIREKKIKF